MPLLTIKLSILLYTRQQTPNAFQGLDNPPKKYPFPWRDLYPYLTHGSPITTGHFYA